MNSFMRSSCATVAVAAVADPALVGAARASQPLDRAQRRDDAVLVEAPAPVGAAVARAPHRRDLAAGAPARRRRRRCRRGGSSRSWRMIRARVDPVAHVERHAEVLGRVEPLQVVHVVGDGRARPRLREQVEVPRLARGGAGAAAASRRCAARPRCAGRGSAPSISRSRSRGVVEQRQRLVGVAGEHDLVEALDARRRAAAASRRRRRGAPTATGVASRTRSANGRLSAST